MASRLVRDAFAARELALGGLQVAEQLELVEEPLVLANVEEDGGAATALGEDEGAPGFADPGDQRGGVRAERGHRLNVLVEAGACHRDSVAHL